MNQTLLFLFFILALKCQGQDSESANIILLVDKDMFISEEIPDHYDSNAERINMLIKKKVIEETKKYSGNAAISIYSVRITPNKLAVTEIQSVATSEDFDFDYNNLGDSSVETEMNDLIELFENHTHQLKESSFKNKLFNHTYILLFSSKINSSSLPTHANTLLQFQEMANFSSNELYTYSYQIYVENSSGTYGKIKQSKPVEFYWKGFELVKKPEYDRILSSTQADGSPKVFNYDRETVAEKRSLKLQPLKESDQIIKARLPENSQIQILDSDLRSLTGESGKSILSSTNKFSANQIDRLGNNSNFPIYSILSSQLELTEEQPTESAYDGELVVKYKVIDPFYSNAVFTETIPFRLAVAKPITIEYGLFKDLELNNANMIRLAHELNLHKSWTQNKLAEEKETHIRITAILTILLLLLLVIVIWAFIIKKKSFTLQNLIFFYKD